MSIVRATSGQAGTTLHPHRGNGTRPTLDRRRTAGTSSAVPADLDVLLGTLLARLRLLAGLTVEEAAAASGISAIRIAGAEEGDGWLPLTDARTLAHTYGLPFVAFAVRFERACTQAERRARRSATPTPVRALR